MFKKILTVALVITMSGCQLFNPISPIIKLGIFWIEGEAHKYYNVNQETIIKSVKSSLTDLEFEIIEEESRKDYYWLKVSDNSKKESHFKIKIREVKTNITKLSIRVNTFGDRPYAEMIYKHVDKKPEVKEFATVNELNAAYRQRNRLISKQ